MDLKDTLKVKITYISDYIQEEILDRITLREIAVGGLLALGISLAIGGHAIHKHIERVNTTPEELATILNENEKPITEQLAEYSIAKEEYETLMKDKNHSDEQEIEKRMELVNQIRGLTSSADKLMEEKIKEAFDLVGTDAKITISRTDRGSTLPPEDVIMVNKDQETLYTSNTFPQIINEIVNCKEGISIFEGSGKHKIWEKDIDNFEKEGTGLYNAIIKLSEKNFVYENGKLKTIDAEKKI